MKSSHRHSSRACTAAASLPGASQSTRLVLLSGGHTALHSSPLLSLTVRPWCWEWLWKGWMSALAASCTDPLSLLAVPPDTSLQHREREAWIFQERSKIASKSA